MSLEPRTPRRPTHLTPGQVPGTIREDTAVRLKTIATSLVMLALAFSLTACAKPPQVDIDAAKAALDKAVAADASKWAPEAWSAAQQAMSAAEAEIKAQADKFALFRSYKKATELYKDALAKADEAQKAAVAGEEKARTEAEAALTAANDAVTAASTVIATLDGCKKRPKGFAADVETFKGNLATMTTQLDAIRASMGTKDYMGAKAQAEALKQQADTAAADVTSAKEKIGCK